jgi:hypothetical protein
MPTPATSPSPSTWPTPNSKPSNQNPTSGLRAAFCFSEEDASALPPRPLRASIFPGQRGGRAESLRSVFDFIACFFCSIANASAPSFALSTVLSAALSIFSPAFSIGPFSLHPMPESNAVVNKALRTNAIKNRRGRNATFNIYEVMEPSAFPGI